MKRPRCPLCDDTGFVLPAVVRKSPGALWGSSDACRVLAQTPRSCPCGAEEVPALGKTGLKQLVLDVGPTCRTLAADNQAPQERVPTNKESSQ